MCEIIMRPIVLVHYCPYCKEAIIKGDSIELREYEHNEKHDWHMCCCTHLLHVYKPDKAVLKEFTEYYSQNEDLKK